MMSELLESYFSYDYKLMIIVCIGVFSVLLFLSVTTHVWIFLKNLFNIYRFQCKRLELGFFASEKYGKRFDMQSEFESQKPFFL